MESIAVGFILGAVIGASAAIFYSFMQRQKFLLEAQGEISRRDQEIIRLQDSLSALQGTLKTLQNGNEMMAIRFENLAQKIFDEKSEKIRTQNQQTLSVYLDPLKERIKDFERKVEDFYSQERSEKGSLRGEINRLVELNQKMTFETSQLSRALKGDVKTQGAWGEFILESVLEKSGLRKNEEYILQGTEMKIKGEHGEHLKPDVVVLLPDQKHLVIDAKVSLASFESYLNSEPEQQEQWAKVFTESLRKHIDGLSCKKYQFSEQLLSPDFVILFMPLEPAFALAFKTRPDLLQEAWDKKIAVVSPTTLLTTLRTVSSLWQQERQTKNVFEIAKRGGALYDKFALLLKDLESLGERIRGTQNIFDQVLSKASQGPGNIIRQIEMLKELGAKAEKQIPAKMLQPFSFEEPFLS